MACARGGLWVWMAAAVAVLAALVFAGCLSTNPAGLSAPEPETPPPPAAAAPAPTAAPAPAPSPAPQEAGGQAFFIYELRKGDTLYSLARRFGVTVEQIEQDNGITSPTTLPIGLRLSIRRVPGVEAPPETR
jgi:hypothetical protein